MASSELERVLERVRQNRALRADSLTAGRTPAISQTAGVLTPHAIGARVFDTVTGQEGEVVGGTRENVIVPTAKR